MMASRSSPGCRKLRQEGCSFHFMGPMEVSHNLSGRFHVLCPLILRLHVCLYCFQKSKAFVYTSIMRSNMVLNI